MSDSISQGRRILIAFATAVLLVVAGYLLIAKPFASKGMPLTADFGDAGEGLTTTSPVKLRGVTVGRISAIGLAPGGGARLEMRINDGVRIPDTVKAALEPESLFGPKFINLIPGGHEGAGPYLQAGAHIGDTSDALDLTNLLGDANKLISAINPQDVAVIVDALGAGLGPSGPDLAGLLKNTGTLVDIAYRHRGEAQTFLADLSRLSMVRGVGTSLGTLIDSGDGLLQTLAAHPGNGLKIAVGIANITSIVGPGLDAHAEDLRQMVRSMEHAASFVDSLLPVAGPGVRSVISLMPNYPGLTWAHGPDNTRLLAVHVLLPTSVCQLILGGGCPNSPKGN